MKMQPSLFSLERMSALAMVFCMMFSSVSSLQPEDRVSAYYQTWHGGWKTPWLDFNLYQMPRFQRADSFVLQTSLPRKSDKEPDMRLNPEEDVKVSLAFASSKLVVPNVIMFDSKKKRSLQKLLITFYYDDFDVLRLSYHPTYGRPIQRLDPNHPSLTAFDVEYQWEAVQEDDLRMAILVMFVVTLLLIGFTVGYISCVYDRPDPSPVAAKVKSSNQASSNSGMRASGAGVYVKNSQ